RDQWEREIQYLAFSNLIDAFEYIHGNRRRFTLKELRAMPERIQRAICSIKVRTENLTPGDDAQDTTIEIKLWDKTKALELGARAHGWLKDKVEVQLSEELLSILDRAKLRARGPEVLAAGDHEPKALLPVIDVENKM